jgi:hypothetical protein
VVCQGDSGFVYSVPPVANATAYIWSLPPGAEITSGNLTNSITVKYSETASSGNYTVAANNICGNGTSSPPYPVTVNPVPPAPVITQQGDSLVSDAPAGNQWYGPNGVVPGATGQSCTPNVNGSYYDIVTLNGCSSGPSNTINFVLTGTVNSTGTTTRIFPNPAGNTLHVELFLEHSSAVSMNLMNITGISVKTIGYGIHARGPVKLILDCTDLKGGIYFLKVTTEGGSFVHKIILEK